MVVHELLECPVCTNSMYPPIHQGNVFEFEEVAKYKGCCRQSAIWCMPSGDTGRETTGGEKSELTDRKSMSPKADSNSKETRSTAATYGSGSRVSACAVTVLVIVCFHLHESWPKPFPEVVALFQRVGFRMYYLLLPIVISAVYLWWISFRQPRPKKLL